MAREELRNKVVKMWREAFMKGTDKAWNSYYRKLKKLADEEGAIGPEALEDWALGNKLLRG